MPRRASSGLHPGLIVALIAIAALAFFAGKSLLGSGGGPALEGSKLDMRAFSENANSLRGNEYVVEGRIDEKLQWTADRGQLVSLKVDEGGGGDETRFISILIPDQLSNVNIERDQPYAFRVSFDRGGIAIAEEVVRQ